MTTETAESGSAMVTDQPSRGIASIPPELLALIFEMSLSKDSKRHPRHKLPFEVILSHVSSHWRAVAVTTPVLWTKIAIYSSRSDCAVNYLQRSGSQLLLDIRVDIYNADKRRCSSRTRNVLIQSVVKTLFPHIHRARSLLVLSCYEDTTLTLLSHFYDSVSPHLRRLRLNFGHPASSQPRIPGPKAFGTKGLPQLTFLETDIHSCLPLPSENLTTLHLHMLTHSTYPSYQSFAAMLTASPSLRNLSIRGSLDVTHWPLHNDSGLSLNNLNALRLSDDESLFAATFLLTISAPNLESLWLGSSYDKYDRFFNAPSIVARPDKFPALKYLTMPFYDLSFCLEFSNVSPNLTHLYLPCASLYHNPLLETVLTSHWRYLDTFVTASLRPSQMAKVHPALSNILLRRHNAGRPIRRILLDDDLRIFLRKQSHVLPHVTIDKLSLETYQEPWWVMSHERHMDHP